MTRSHARILVLLLSLFVTQAAWAEKTDIIFMKNGDRITGEVDTLDRGILKFKTDHMGTVIIEWEDIREIISKTGQSIELADGRRLYGPLVKSPGEGMVGISTDQGDLTINTLDVISMYPVEATFWDRLDMSARLGFNWDKGSDVGRFSLGLDAEYRRPESITKTEFNAEVTSQRIGRDTTRASLTASHDVYLSHKKFRPYFVSLEQNDELGIDLRTLVGAGYGWVPVRSQRNWLSLSAGLAVNHEIPNLGSSETNVEGVGTLVYEFFQYSSPERSFMLDLQILPSLTDFGRWRTNLDTDFRLELVEDLFWSLSFYARYDSGTLSKLGESSDYGVITSFGYSF